MLNLLASCSSSARMGDEKETHNKENNNLQNKNFNTILKGLQHPKIDGFKSSKNQSIWNQLVSEQRKNDILSMPIISSTMKIKVHIV